MKLYAIQVGREWWRGGSLFTLDGADARMVSAHTLPGEVHCVMHFLLQENKNPESLRIHAIPERHNKL